MRFTLQNILIIARPYICCSSCRNFPFAIKDELTSRVFTKNDGTPTPTSIPVIFCAPISIPTPVLVVGNTKEIL